MPRSLRRRAYAITIGLLYTFAAPGNPARAQLLPPISASQAAVPSDMTLQLEVYVNGTTTQLVEPFTLTPDKRMLVARGDLEDIGLKPPGRGDARSPVDLASLPDVTYRYDE